MEHGETGMYPPAASSMIVGKATQIVHHRVPVFPIVEESYGVSDEIELENDEISLAEHSQKQTKPPSSLCLVLQ
jgi:hypothetical protein